MTMNLDLPFTHTATEKSHMDLVWMIGILASIGIPVSLWAGMRARKKAAESGRWSTLREAMDDQDYWHMVYKEGQDE